jgi:DNA-binding CsgD family transcriptional regulator
VSRFIGSRIGVIRGLEAFATLAIREQRPDRAVQLAAAAAALREQAHLPSLSGTRTERYLTAARGLGQETITQLWEQGSALDASAAVDLALTMPDDARVGEAPGPRSRPGTRAPAPGGLTPRELEIVALIAATAARHVANILLKLGFSSRAQVAAWATRESRNGGPPAG